MTSPESLNSPDDPSPAIMGLADDALGLQLDERYHYDDPEHSLNTLESMGGSIVLRRLMPELSVPTVYSLSDAIARDGEVILTDTGSLVVRSSQLFSGWVKKLWSPRHREGAVMERVDTEVDLIEIIEPITGQTRQTYLKTYPESHGIVVRQSSFSGSFSINDELHTFDPEQTVLEVGRLNYDAGSYGSQISPKGQRFYTHVSGSGDTYRSKRYGGSIHDTAIKNVALKSKTLVEMKKVLEEVRDTHHLINW